MGGQIMKKFYLVVVFTIVLVLALGGVSAAKTPLIPARYRWKKSV